MGPWYLDLYHIGMSSISRQDNSKNELEDKLNKNYNLNRKVWSQRMEYICS